MIDKITELIKENLKPGGEITLSKFHHGDAKKDSKVLFLANCRSKPLCIVKIARDFLANEKLKKERSFQEKFSKVGKFLSPKIYFDGEIGGLYFYAEEVVKGVPFSQKRAHKKEKEVVKMISRFSHDGEISVKKLYKIFSQNSPKNNTEIDFLLKDLGKKEITLKKGFSHGDLTRKNIIEGKKDLYLIDWDRGNHRPLWLIDAVHFMVSLRNIKDKEKWNKKVSPVLSKYTGVGGEELDALYIVETLFEIFCKKYPDKYKAIVKEMRQL